jgi:hypothetical protein
MRTAVALAQLARDAGRHRQAELTLWEAVTRAREAGATWTQIGQLLGVSAQAAHKRFTKPPRGSLTGAVPLLRGAR